MWSCGGAAYCTGAMSRHARTAKRCQTDFFASEDDGQLSDSEQRELPDGEFVMAMSRFIPYKRLDLAIRTAANVGLPIVVAGSVVTANVPERAIVQGNPAAIVFTRR